MYRHVYEIWMGIDTFISKDYLSFVIRTEFTWVILTSIAAHIIEFGWTLSHNSKHGI